MIGPPPNQPTIECAMKYIEWVQQPMLQAFTFTYGLICPLDLMIGPPPNQPTIECAMKYIEWVQQPMLQAFTFTYGIQLDVAAKRQKRNYDRGLKPREFNEGAWIWRWYLPLASRKLG